MSTPLDIRFSLPLAPTIDPEAPVFDAGPVSQMNTELVGMATKRRDPADVLLMQTFIAKHGLARLVGIAPKQRGRPFVVMSGLTRCPLGAAHTVQGERYVGDMAAVARSGKPVVGEAAYRAQQTVRNNAGVYEDRLSVTESGMSLGDGKYYRLSRDGKVDRQAVPKSQKLPMEGKLPEWHCQNPECLKEIDKKRHHNAQYCPGDSCRERAKELRRLHKVKQAGRPILYRNESDVSDDFTNDINPLETDIVSPHISRGMFSKDCPVEVVVYPQ